MAECLVVGPQQVHEVVHIGPLLHLALEMVQDAGALPLLGNRRVSGAVAVLSLECGGFNLSRARVSVAVLCLLFGSLLLSNGVVGGRLLLC